MAGASAPALAQEPVTEVAVAETTDGTDIVVTAQKRSERLQDVPIAVSALGGDSLEKQRVTQAVVASPDPTRGEVVKAFVVLAKGHHPSDELAKALQDHVKAATAPYKYPRRIAFVESLPKTVSGKIRRKELRDAEFRDLEFRKANA